MLIWRILLVAAVAAPAMLHAEWGFSWRTDPATGEATCSVSSDARRVGTGSGGTEALVRLGVQGESRITLESDSVPFDAKKLYETSIRVDDNPPVVRLDQSKDGRVLTFSEEDSIALHRQFETGSTVFVVMVFAPKGRPVTQQYPLDGYLKAAGQYKGCRGLLINPGWLGLFMSDAAKDPEWLAWVRSATPYTTPGIIIVTVDPRKEAAKNDLRPGDRILAVNGREAEVKDLIRMMKDLEAGRSIELDVVRDRARIKKTLTRPAVADRED